MSLIKKLEKSLTPSKFRLITSYMSKNTNLKRITHPVITAYHRGYKLQTSKWPTNPVNYVIDYINLLQLNKRELQIVDIGCGEARLASEFQNVVSIDLFPVNELIIKADLELLPIDGDSQDVIVYCLSLLKGDIFKALAEGNRVLKTGGTCLIMETKGRIDPRDFEKCVTNFLGFQILKKELIDGYFSFYALKKVGPVIKTGVLRLASFEYKRR